MSLCAYHRICAFVATKHAIIDGEHFIYSDSVNNPNYEPFKAPIYYTFNFDTLDNDISPNYGLLGYTSYWSNPNRESGFGSYYYVSTKSSIPNLSLSGGGYFLHYSLKGNDYIFELDSSKPSSSYDGIYNQPSDPNGNHCPFYFGIVSYALEDCNENDFGAILKQDCQLDFNSISRLLNGN